MTGVARISKEFRLPSMPRHGLEPRPAIPGWFAVLARLTRSLN
jgi:hypothetical protein